MTKTQKASDVFNNTDLLFAEKVNFGERFPQIEDLKVEVEESGYGVKDWNRKSTYDRTNLPGEFINCKNPHCYKGGFSIGSILHEMVKNSQTELEKSEYCQGYEGSPKGRVKHRTCINSFKIKIFINYRSKS